MDHSLINHTNQIAALLCEITASKKEKLKLKSLEWHHVTAHILLGTSSIAIIILIIFNVQYCKKKSQSINVKCTRHCRFAECPNLNML